MLEQLFARGGVVEMPFGQARQRGGAIRAGQGGQSGQGAAIGHQDFRRAQAREFAREQALRDLRDAQFAAGETQPGKPDAVVLGCEREQQVVGFLVQQRRVGERARRDDARDRALHRTFGGVRVADLLADRDRLAQLQQLGQILLGRVVGHAGHFDRRAGGSAARGERDVEQPRRLLRVVVEQLVEIAHAVEQQDVRMLRFQAQVLLHHRRVGALGGRVSAHGVPRYSRKVSIRIFR